MHGNLGSGFRELVSKQPTEHILEELHKDSQKLLFLKLVGSLSSELYQKKYTEKHICQCLENTSYCDKIYEILFVSINVDTR